MPREISHEMEPDILQEYDMNRMKARNDLSVMSSKNIEVLKKFEYNDTGKDNDPVDSWSPFNANEKVQSVSAMNNFDARTMPLVLELEERRFESNSLIDASSMRPNKEFNN